MTNVIINGILIPILIWSAVYLLKKLKRQYNKMSKDLRKSETDLSRRLIAHVETLHEIFPMNDEYCFRQLLK